MRGKLFSFVVFCILLTGVGPLAARDFPLPPGFKFDGHGDMRKYSRYIVPAVGWLQETPLNEHKEQRKLANSFVMYWLQINPDMSISLPEYAYKFHDIDQQLLYLFMEGWIKYALETRDTSTTDCSIAGIHSMVDYYKSGKATGLGKNELLDNLAEIDRLGRLRELFDSGRQARNTYLYLRSPSEKHTFRYDENYFNFSFWTINLVNPRKIVYRYMLDGYFDKWITTKDGSVTYPRLPSGNYTFRVQAAMSDRFTNPAEVTWSFTIHKPVWQENWFLFLVIASASLLAYFIIMQREKNLKNIALLKHERIMFEYEHLKSQVNPHFLFNSLNTLTYLIATDQDKAITYTENLSSLYHSILAHHDNDLVLLQEEMAVLENYFLVQKGRFGEALRLHVDIPPAALQHKKIVPLAMQILIENVIKHNVIAGSEPLTIFITATENEITIRNVVSPRISKEKGEGLGLINIRRRYELLTRKPVTYGLYEDEFIVILPLL